MDAIRTEHKKKRLAQICSTEEIDELYMPNIRGLVEEGKLNKANELTLEMHDILNLKKAH